MDRRTRWILFILVVAGLGLWGCTQSSVEAAPQAGAVAAATSAGTTRSPVRVSSRAAERLGIQTGPVEQRLAGRTAVPYAAVMYGVHGDAWVYTNPEPLVFVRAQVRIDDIEGTFAVLSDGPPLGTLVVTVGAAELFGTETGVGDPE